MGTYYLHKIIGLYAALYPGIEIDLRFGNSDYIIDRIGKRRDSQKPYDARIWKNLFKCSQNISQDDFRLVYIFSLKKRGGSFSGIRHEYVADINSILHG